MLLMEVGVIDYDVGDCVVCVDDGALPGYVSSVKIGQIYRVDGFLFSDRNRPSILGKPSNFGVVLQGIKSKGSSGAFSPFRFRKLPPATDDFKRLMRECRPKVDA